MNVGVIDADSPVLEEIKGFKDHCGSPMPLYLIFFKDSTRVATISVPSTLDTAFFVMDFLRRCIFIDTVIVAHDARLVTTTIDDDTVVHPGSLDDTNSQRALSVYVAGENGPMYCSIPYRERHGKITWGKALTTDVVLQMGGEVMQRSTQLMSQTIPDRILKEYRAAVSKGRTYEEALQVVLKVLVEKDAPIIIHWPEVQI